QRGIEKLEVMSPSFFLRERSIYGCLKRSKGMFKLHEIMLLIHAIDVGLPVSLESSTVLGSMSQSEISTSGP
ncbi:hypothetical protein HAX54_053073, partial [Datura stramonium]|nr:hypothetical protein [Datura stramonium]